MGEIKNQKERGRKNNWYDDLNIVDQNKCNNKETAVCN
jgi:hypothetical protein